MAKAFGGFKLIRQLAAAGLCDEKEPHVTINVPLKGPVTIETLSKDGYRDTRNTGVSGFKFGSVVKELLPRNCTDFAIDIPFDGFVTVRSTSLLSDDALSLDIAAALKPEDKVAYVSDARAEFKTTLEI